MERYLPQPESLVLCTKERKKTIIREELMATISFVFVEKNLPLGIETSPEIVRRGSSP